MDGRISDATNKTRSLERENKAALASLQTCIDGLEAKQVNTVAEVRSAMEAQLSKLKAHTETSAKETLEQMAELMDCIQSVNVEGNTNLTKLKDSLKGQILEQKQVTESSIRLISDSIANKNMDQDSKMSFISKKQVDTCRSFCKRKSVCATFNRLVFQYKPFNLENKGYLRWTFYFISNGLALFHE